MKIASTLQDQNTHTTCVVDSVSVTMTGNFADENVTEIFEDKNTNVTEMLDDTEIEIQEQWEQSSQWWGRCGRHGDWKWM